MLLFASVLGGADDRLAAIHALLVPTRTAPIADARGATPALTKVKHQLRDWIESRIVALQWKDAGWTVNPTVLQEQLNDELSHAGLVCPQDATCWPNPLGYLNRVVLEVQSGFLAVRTSIGVQTCGADDSAYIYESTDDGWRRIWQSEQNNYEEKTYFPQRLVDVKISPTDWHRKSDRTEHLIVTTGAFPWCTSVWQPVYYRVWQTKSTYPVPRLLLDEREQADIADPIHARANRNDVFIEFQVIADDAERMSELKHYVLENGKLHRTDPVALTPQEFVSFWLRHPWNDVSGWTAQAGRAKLKAWHQRYNSTNSEFTPPTRHCTLHPDLWQVATDPGIDLQPAHYFLIRARPPFRFTMVAASDRPWPDCTEDDPAIDIAPDLFGN
ncbi:MAG TPA: hypothetical protein VGV35_04840 [Bryobacteraceae bacterium]|nr:hypothetical protein [Bryobacteraceae bacterium]